MTALADARADRPLAGRTVLVAGAYGGFGGEVSVACARAGASLVLLGRKLPKLNRIHDRVAAEGGEVFLYPFDLEGASPADHADLAQRIEQGVGRLSGLVHCAASFTGLTPLEHTDPGVLARDLHVNLTARAWMTQACLPLLRRAGDAAVVFLVDETGRNGDAYRGGYGIAQHGVEALVGMFHRETEASGLRVAGLRPGPMRTPLRARAYVADEDLRARPPADYADACVALLGPAGAAWRGQVRTLGAAGGRGD